MSYVPVRVEIDPVQSDVVQRNFADYNRGMSPKAIAQQLNAEGIRGPRTATWNPSTIYGNYKRGTGILNNELYAGRLVWNRQRFLKDPTTGKRVARLNPVSELVARDVKDELQIVDDVTWSKAKARQATTRKAVDFGREGWQPGQVVRARRPIYLFSGLTKCGVCGAGFILSSRDTLRCHAYIAKSTCTNGRSIRRQELEGRALRALRERFFEPGAFAEFCKAFTTETNRLRMEARPALDSCTISR